MDIMTIGLAIGLGGVLLFLWTGFTQNVLPWGIKSVQQTQDSGELGKQLLEHTPAQMLYLHDSVAAFIAIKPASYYSMGRYFAIEFLTQLLTASVLTTILLITVDLATTQRLFLITLIGLIGITSIDLQYWNWWGFSTRYTLGVAVNRILGYVLVAWILIQWVL